MTSALCIPASPAAMAGVVVGIGLPAATGFRTWSALAHGRLAFALWPPFADGVLTFLPVQRFAALPAG